MFKLLLLLGSAFAESRKNISFESRNLTKQNSVDSKMAENIEKIPYFISISECFASFLQIATLKIILLLSALTQS